MRMFLLYVSIECRVTQISLSAIAYVDTAFVVVLRAAALTAFFLVHFVTIFIRFAAWMAVVI